MSAATVVLNIETPNKSETISCNGVPDERAEVKKRFEEIMATKQYFAYVETSPGHAEQVRTFTDVENIENKVGVANVTISPALQGG